MTKRVSGSSMRLRRRTGADLEPLEELWAASWAEAMPAIDFSARRDWFRAHLPALEAEGGATICACAENGEMLGFVVINPVTGYLDQIAVAPHAKGSGAATALLREARRISRRPVFLDVNQDNPRALRFYMREGFEIAEAGVNSRSGLKTWRLHARVKE